MYRKEAMEARRIARERIEKLFGLARDLAASGEKERSRMYIMLARRIGMKLDIPLGHRREYCRKCNSYLIPGRNARVRMGRKKVTLTCLECGKVTRFPFGTRERAGRRESSEYSEKVVLR
ncbi:MAG: hypothetical protein M1417_02035 [Candidatus Thermoplasmatota archaeon]|nr:hypothetical protein [Candidatus Thermoplasmatota archaeon]MCL5437458.1 hypothetical protein [Candidatus Thermoplasmatota archaeon]